MRRLHLLAVAALITGCGSTVPLSQQVGAAGGLQPAVVASPSYAASSANGKGSYVGGASAPPPMPPRSDILPRTGETTGAQDGATRGSTAAADRRAIEVGFFVLKDLGPAAKALGVDGLSTGNAANQVSASVEVLNSRGGINGRPVKPVVFEYDVTQDANTQFQAACGMFFDDHRVAAVVGAIINTTIQACSSQHGVPYVMSGTRTTSTSDLARNPYLVIPSQLDLARVVATQVSSLGARGFFKARSGTEQVKIGLIYNEDPDYAQAPSLVGAALKKLGLTLTDKQSMPGVDDTSRVAAASTAGQNAVLRFAAAHITHVLVVDKGGQAIAYFAVAAQNQSYYPSFGISSLELPATLRTVLSQRQVQGAMGVGWLPSFDTPVVRQPTLSANATACVRAMTKAGEDMTGAATRGSALATCDSTLLLGAAWKGQADTTAGFLAGLRALDTAWPPVMTFLDDFSARRDGVSRIRPIAYQSHCDCFVYTGPLTPASS